MANFIKWTDEMLGVLIDDFPITPDRMLAEKLEISVSSVRRKAKELHLAKASISNYRTMQAVDELFATHSQKQIAQKLNISIRTVRRICKTLNLKRDKDEDAVMRSKGLKRIYESDFRRSLYGLEQRVNRFIGKSKERLKIYDELKRYGYILIKGSRTVYYSSEMRRIVHVESYAKALGLVFEEWNAE